MHPVQDKDAVGIFNRITYTYADGCQIVLDGEAKDEKVAYIEGPKGKLYKNFVSDIPDLASEVGRVPGASSPTNGFRRFRQKSKNICLE
jgi:myo-inositol 2-dehydrogenase / D-chiro-inositol 1-dehydrogenase